MKWFRLMGAAALAAGALAVAGAANANCKLIETAEFHVDPNSVRPIVSGRINGQPVRILFDIGSQSSLVPLSEAKRLGLAMARRPGDLMWGIGGSTIVYDTMIRELTIGGFTTEALRLRVAGDPDAKPDVSLILGDDFFSQTDAEFDLRHGVVRLFEPHDCTPPQLVYWGAPYSQATILPWDRDWPVTQTRVDLNGQQIFGQFDTGDAATLVDRLAADLAGISRADETPGAVTRGIWPHPEPTRIARFGTLTVGDEKLSNVRLQIVDMTEGSTLRGTPTILLAADFFHAHRVFVDNKDHLVLFSYEGGQVFQPPAPAPPPGG